MQSSWGSDRDMSFSRWDCEHFKKQWNSILGGGDHFKTKVKGTIEMWWGEGIHLNTAERGACCDPISSHAFTSYLRQENCSVIFNKGLGRVLLFHLCNKVGQFFKKYHYQKASSWVSGVGHRGPHGRLPSFQHPPHAQKMSFYISRLVVLEDIYHSLCS